MPKYTYTVRDENGKTLHGSYETDSREKIILALQRKGYLVLSVTEASEKAGIFSKNQKRKIGGKVPGHVLAFFAEQLATLISGGVPLVRAVQLLGEYSSNANLGAVLQQVAKDISSGQSLHGALAQHPKTFSHVWVSLVEAGELGGQLAETLTQVALYTKTQEHMKSKIITAVTYPSVLALASIGVLIYFIVGIVPTFAQIFKDFNLELPLLTVTVLRVSAVLVNHGILIIAVLVLTFVAFRFYIKTKEGQWAVFVPYLL